MSIAEVILLVLAAVGHVVLWMSLVNRIHGTGLSQWLVHLLTVFCWTMMVVIVVAVSVGAAADRGTWIALLYLLPCVLMAISSAGRRIRMLIVGDRPAALLSNHTTSLDLLEELGHRPAGDRRTELLSRLPGNEVFRLDIQRKELRIARIEPQLDGLTIAHVSDLHMSGRIGKSFYQHVVERVNDEQADLIAITGDLFDTESCVEWGREILGLLRARHGVYFVLGNHDRRVDAIRARRQLVDCGWIDLGGRWVEVAIGEQRVVLAGNELPWFSPAADMTDCPGADTLRTEGDDSPADSSSKGGGRPLRVLLSHAPDQIEWARQRDFDLMLSGHTHGGQIRFPVLGPIVSPSRLGTQYASGTFEVPPTLLHVSRGIASLMPIRWNCPPELAVLVLRK